jgi:transcriptional regulator with XRE-family HTH domain
MDISPLANRISSLRKGQGLSQEALADKASISLRTLQRIERGKTEPRGHTLRQLANALDTSAEALSAGSPTQSKTFLHLLNLASLAFWVFPGANLGLVWLLWVIKKDSLPGVDQLGRSILRFQLGWSMLTYGLMLLAGVATFLGLLERLPLIGIVGGILIVAFYLINSVIILRATDQINRGQPTLYGFTGAGREHSSLS